MFMCTHIKCMYVYVCMSACVCIILQRYLGINAEIVLSELTEIT